MKCQNKAWWTSIWKLGEKVPEKKLNDQTLGEIVLGEIVAVEKISFHLKQLTNQSLQKVYTLKTNEYELSMGAQRPGLTLVQNKKHSI